MKSKKFGKDAKTIVNDCLEWTAKKYPRMKYIIDTIYVKERDDIPTMQVEPASGGGTWLSYSPEFVILGTEYFHNTLPKKNSEKYGKTYICCVVWHELEHILQKHLDQMEERHYNQRTWNLATDTMINANIAWGEGQFALSSTYDRKLRSGIDHDGSIQSLRNIPFWHVLMPNTDTTEKRLFNSAISPMSVWLAIQQSCAKAVAEYVGSPYSAEESAIEFDAGRTRLNTMEWKVVNGKQKLFGFSGFDKNASSLFPDKAENIEKAITIYSKIMLWLNTRVIIEGVSSNKLAEKWYSLYSELDDYATAFLSLMGHEGKAELPRCFDNPSIGPETGARINNLIRDLELEYKERQAHGYSNSTEQFRAKLGEFLKEEDTTEWARLLDICIGKSRKHDKTKTFFRPHRRWGEIFPGTKKRWNGCVNIAIDTSGSVAAKTLRMFFDQLLLQAAKHDELSFNLVLYNSVVYSVIEDWDPKDGVPPLQISGTNFTVALDKLQELYLENGGLCIMFTDGECYSPPEHAYKPDFRKWLAWVIWPMGDDSNKWGGQGVIRMPSV